MDQLCVDCVVGIVSAGVSVGGKACSAAMTSVLTWGEVAASAGLFITVNTAGGVCTWLKVTTRAQASSGSSGCVGDAALGKVAKAWGGGDMHLAD